MIDTCRVWVAGNLNTGTNLVENMVKSQNCTPIYNKTPSVDQQTLWKHKLLKSEDLDRLKEANVDAIIVTTRHPYCWASGMKKTPYKKWFLMQGFGGLEAGEAWNRYMHGVSEFSDTAAKNATITAEILPYEAIISDELGKGLQSFKSVLPAARNMTQREFDNVLVRPSKNHGKPRSLAAAQLAASTQCKNELSVEEIEKLYVTIDHELAAKFGYRL